MSPFVLVICPTSRGASSSKQQSILSQWRSLFSLTKRIPAACECALGWHRWEILVNPPHNLPAFSKTSSSQYVPNTIWTVIETYVRSISPHCPLHLIFLPIVSSCYQNVNYWMNNDQFSGICTDLDSQCSGPSNFGRRFLNLCLSVLH